MSRTKRVLVIGAGVVFGGLLVVTGWIEFRNSKKLAAEGKAVTAEVTGKDIERGRRGRKSYYLEVQFKTEAGATEAQSVKVSSSQYDGAKVGGNVPVHYLPSDPKICQVGEKVETKWSMMLWGLGAWAASAFVGFSKSDDDDGSKVFAAPSDLASTNAGSDDQRKAA
jgi:Protein of unknown function (DUF3592)